MEFETINVRRDDNVCVVTFNRPHAKNTINDRMILELHYLLFKGLDKCTLVVLEGNAEYFCFGADFNQLKSKESDHDELSSKLYEVWLCLASGPFISVAYVRGRANAGGIGFLASCDVVLADETAVFSLSELIFGLFPACVLPFLVRRIGWQKSNYFALMTKPIGVQQAMSWGLVDAWEPSKKSLLGQHLSRLRKITNPEKYKEYMSTLGNEIKLIQPRAVAANQEMFSNPENVSKIKRFTETGKLPWEPP